MAKEIKEAALRDYIIDKYGNLKRFADAIGIPKSTLYTILQRGINNAGVNTAIKICSELNLDLESLSAGKIMEKPMKRVDVTANEDKLLQKYRTLGGHGREVVDSLLDSEYKHVTQENKSHIRVGAEFDKSILIAASGAENFNESQIQALNRDIERLKPEGPGGVNE